MQGDVRHFYSHTFTGLLKMVFYKASILPLYVFQEGNKIWILGKIPTFMEAFRSKTKAREDGMTPDFMNHTNQCLYLIVIIALICSSAGHSAAEALCEGFLLHISSCLCERCYVKGDASFLGVTELKLRALLLGSHSFLAVVQHSQRHSPRVKFLLSWGCNPPGGFPAHGAPRDSFCRLPVQGPLGRGAFSASGGGGLVSSWWFHGSFLLGDGAGLICAAALQH